MPSRELYVCVLLSISDDFSLFLEYSLSIALVFFTFIIPGSRDTVQVVKTVQIDLQKFRFTEPGSNLAFVLKTSQKGHVIAFYKIAQ